eukprot:COSAG05_NODE_23662_length_256_cov_0.955414_1_plen_42_part_10
MVHVLHRYHTGHIRRSIRNRVQESVEIRPISASALRPKIDSK